MERLRYQAVIFDLDGTLVDSYTALADAINHARQESGLTPLSNEFIRSCVGDGVQLLLSRSFPDGVPERAQALFEQRYDDICCAQSRVLEHVEETLASLDEQGVRMAVCTNKPTSFSRKIVDHLGIGHYFGAVVGPDAAGARKPDGRHIRETLAAAGATELRSLFVGDMPVDVAAARNGGLDVAVVATGSSPAEALRSAMPDYFLESFRDLVALVKAEEGTE